MVSQQKLTSFGRKVKRELIDLNMTQTELARKVGTTPQYLNLILYGHRTGNKYKDKIEEVLFPDKEQGVKKSAI